MDLPGGRAQRLQNADVVEVATRIPVGSQRHGDAGQQDGQQAAEQQETLGAIDGSPDRRVGIADAGPTVVRRQVAPDCIEQRSQGVIFAGHHQPVADAAARLHDLRRGDVLDPHQQSRCEVHEAAAPIRFPGNDGGEGEVRVADGHPVTHFDP